MVVLFGGRLRVWLKGVRGEGSLERRCGVASGDDGGAHRGRNGGGRVDGDGAQLQRLPGLSLSSFCLK